VDSLRRIIGAVVGWMGQYQFDPVRVELGFGVRGAELPAWTLALDERHRLALRGRIDRVDLAATAADGNAACVVIDYKSSARRFDRVLAAQGIQMQLPAYLNVVRRSPELAALLGVTALRPAGVFYVNLRGATSGSPNRSEALEAVEASARSAYRHEGLFDVAELRRLDARPDATVGDQFDYRLTASGAPRKDSRSALGSGDFAALLDQQEELLLRLGRRIFGGEVRVDPYRKGRETPCGGCDYASVCRIDPWTHRYRELGRPGEPAGEGKD
jgi:ATP-dependent helicase/nuclease subunit B